jgi:protein TonB
VARGATTSPQAQTASLGSTATKPAAAAPVVEAPRDVVPFGEGMTRPVLMTPGRPITYTREAIAARVEGVSIVRCVITAEGSVERCKVIKPLPFMDEPVVEHLQSQRFQPVTYQGKPVSVGYNFSVRLTLPK